MQQHMRRCRHHRRHVHINDLEAVGEGRRLHAFQRHRLPRTRRAADCDQRTDAVPRLDRADLRQKRSLIGEVSVHKLEEQRGRHQRIGRCREDDGVLIEQHFHDLLFVILLIQRTAGIFAHGHAHGAGGTSRAVQQVIVLEVDHCDFRALLLTCQQCFLQKNIAVAVLASCRNAHYLKFHSASPFRSHHFSCKRAGCTLFLLYGISHKKSRE